MAQYLAPPNQPVAHIYEVLQSVIISKNNYNLQIQQLNVPCC